MTDEATAVEAPKKRARKLEKFIDGTIVKLTALGGEKGQMSCDFDLLPEPIKAKLGPFGLSHKLGDAAAGKEGVDAEVAIQKVYDGLIANNWSVRAPAVPKVGVADIVANFQNLSDKEKKAAAPLLKSLGIALPD